jgi:hypothetical protein
LSAVFVGHPLASSAQDEKPKALKMSAKRNFTDRFLKSIKPAQAGRRITYWDLLSGFGIRVSDKS